MDEESEPPQRPFPPALEYAVGLAWRLLLLAGAAWLVVYVFLALRIVTVPAVIALLLATLLDPPTQALRRHRCPALLATWTVLLAAVALVAGVALLLVPPVSEEFGQLGSSVEGAIRQIEDWLVDGPLRLSGDELDRYVDTAIDRVGGNASSIASQLATGAYLAFEVIAGLLLAFVLTFFFVKDGGRIAHGLLGFVPERRRAFASTLGRRGWEVLTAYVRGTALVGAVNAAAVAVGLFVIGVPLVVPLAVLTFLGAFFPLVGAVVAGAIAALVALVSGGVTKALLVVGLVVIVQQVEGDVLWPVVMGRALRLHPVVILIALTVGAVTAGLLGAFLAVPTAALVAAAVEEVRAQRAPQAPRSVGGPASGDQVEG